MTDAVQANAATYQQSLSAPAQVAPQVDALTQQALAIQAQNQAAAQAASQAPAQVAPQATQPQTPQGAPQVPQVAPQAPSAGDWDGDVSKLPQGAQELIRSLRGENADKRIRAQEAEAKLREAKTLDEFNAAQKEWVDSNLALSRELAAVAAGLPPEMGVRLQGTTLDELKADALALVQGIPNLNAQVQPPVLQQENPPRGGLTPGATGAVRTPAELAELVRKVQGNNLI